MEEITLQLYYFCVDGTVNIESKKWYGREMTNVWARYANQWERIGFTIQVKRMALDRAWVAHSQAGREIGCSYS